MQKRNLIAMILIIIILVSVLSTYFFVYNVDNTKVISQANKGEVGVYVNPSRGGEVSVNVVPLEEKEEVNVNE